MYPTPSCSRILNIKTLIVFLAFLVMFITLVNTLYASYKVQKYQLIRHTLDTNHAYTQKLASATDDLINAAFEQLGYAAKIIGHNFSDKSVLMREAERLQLQTKTFNSVTVVNSEGLILAASSNRLNIIGLTLTVGGGPEAIAAKKPLVGTPHLTRMGELLLLISYPIFDASGKYLGYVGGSIYLKKESILNELLGQHFHQDGSYIYVVDKNKQLIYHPDPDKVGQHILNNTAINKVIDNQNGSIQIINSSGIQMLAGFSPITTANWGVVAQRPLKATLSSLDELMIQVIYYTLPLGLFTLVLIWILANSISRPICQLSAIAGKINSPNAQTNLTKIKSWYFEIEELKKALLEGLGLINNQIVQLKEDAATDPLTGAVNRRSLHLLLKKLEQKNIPFSALVIDIDHFKKVNDTYGHAVGDKVLIELTQLMHKISRKQDIVARTGGEEFLLILPGTPGDLALMIAERLRTQVSELRIEPVGTLSVSIGVATSSKDTQSSDELLKQADLAMYQAKKSGRNRCEVFKASINNEPHLN